MTGLSDATNAWLSAHYDDLVGWRRHIHTHPELGRQEFDMAEVRHVVKGVVH